MVRIFCGRFGTTDLEKIINFYINQNKINKKKDFLSINNEWYTFIDYERFHDLYNEYLRSGAQFTSMDYIAKTPSWALFGAQEGGFDPADTRHYRKQVPKNTGGC